MPLEHGTKKSFDTVSRSVLGSIESDGRTWNIRAGTWTADGAKLTTSTARGSEPLITVTEPYSDFDMSIIGRYGDAAYFRYKDANNWMRVTQFAAPYSVPYNCNPYNYSVVVGYQNCNARQCTGSTYNYQTCTSYCQNYAENQCYDQCPNYYSYACGCYAYSTVETNFACGGYCYYSGSFVAGYSCGSWCYFGYRCGTSHLNNSYYANGNAGTCNKYYGAYTCPNTCWAESGTYYNCNQRGCGTYYGLGTYYACGSYDCSYTSYYTYTCYDQCEITEPRTDYQTCYTNYFPVYLRLEKKVNGTLSTVQEVNVGENAYMTTIRVTGKGSNIQVFSDRSPTTPHINQTVTDGMYNNIYGVGRVGLGSEDSGNTLDNISIKPFGQPG